MAARTSESSVDLEPEDELLRAARMALELSQVAKSSRGRCRGSISPLELSSRNESPSAPTTQNTPLPTFSVTTQPERRVDSGSARRYQYYQGATAVNLSPAPVSWENDLENDFSHTSLGSTRDYQCSVQSAVEAIDFELRDLADSCGCTTNDQESIRSACKTLQGLIDACELRKTDNSPDSGAGNLDEFVQMGYRTLSKTLEDLIDACTPELDNLDTSCGCAINDRNTLQCLVDACNLTMPNNTRSFLSDDLDKALESEWNDLLNSCGCAMDDQDLF
ncbi:hypothetical protein ACEPPN_006512 [Leptodophora sp. 'Broadleaf-Isolate-01']